MMDLNDLGALNAALASRTFLSSHLLALADEQALAHIESSSQLQSELDTSRTKLPHVFSDTAPMAAQVAQQQQGVLDRLQRVQLLASQCQSRVAQLQGVSVQTPCEWQAVLGPDDQLASHCQAAGFEEIEFKRVPGDYYDRSLEERKSIVGASSVHQLCKTIVMQNTKWNAEDASSTNPQFLCAILQYSSKLNADAVKKAVADRNPSIARSKFNFQLAKTEDSARLTGYEHNAVVPIGMKTALPILLSDKIHVLKPSHFWLGAGQVDVKLRVDVDEFNRLLKPIVARIVH